MFLLHLGLTPAQDDLEFAKVLDQYNIFNWIFKIRYLEWSSRLFIEFLLVVISRLPTIVWRLLDTIIFTLITYMTSLIFNKKKDIRNDYIIILLYLIYPINHIISAGPIATTLNYLWPLLGLLYVLYIVIEEETRTIKLYEKILLLFAYLISSSHEQTCLLGCSFIFLILVKRYINNKKDFTKNNILSLVVFVLFVIYGVVIITCPGNSLRYNQSATRYWNGSWQEFGILEKLYLGIIILGEVMIENKMMIGLFGLVLFLDSKRNKSIIIRFLGDIQFFYILVFFVFNDLLYPIFPYLETFKSVVFDHEIIKNGFSSFISISNIIPVCSIIIFFLMVLILLFQIFDNYKAFLILLAGILSGVIIGFSPTVYASNYRTLLFFMISLLIIIYLVTVKNQWYKYSYLCFVVFMTFTTYLSKFMIYGNFAL